MISDVLIIAIVLLAVTAGSYALGSWAHSRRADQDPSDPLEP